MRRVRPITRREALALAFALAIGCHLSSARAQSGGSLFWRIFARAPLYGVVAVVLYKVFADDKPTAAAKPATDAIDAAEKALARRQEEERLAVERAARRAAAIPFARHTGMDETTAEQVVERIGIDQAKQIVEQRLAVWPQRDTTDQRVLDVALENRSGEAIAGAMWIAIDDVASNAREFAYRYHNYRIEPWQTLHWAVPFRAPFKTSGLKRIALINQPRQVATTAVELFVLPGEIRRA